MCVLLSNCLGALVLIAFTQEFTIVDIFHYALGEGLDIYVDEKIMDNPARPNVARLVVPIV